MDNITTPETENSGLRRIILCALFGVFLCTAVGCASSGLTPYAENPASTGVTPAAKAAPRKIVTGKTEIPTKSEYMSKVAWSPDSKLFATLQKTAEVVSVVIYDAETKIIIKTLEPKKCGPYKGIYRVIVLEGDIAFSPDGRYLAGGVGIITLWDTKTWEPVKDILGPFARGSHAAEAVRSIAFSPDSRSLAILYKAVIWPESIRVDGRMTLGERRSSKSITDEAALIVFNIDTM